MLAAYQLMPACLLTKDRMARLGNADLTCCRFYGILPVRAR